MRVLLGVLIVLLSAAESAFAVHPEFWRIRSADEFLAGESEGLSVAARGRLLAGPSVQRVARLDEPFVLSQASDGAGTLYLGTGNDGRIYRLRGEQLSLVFDADEPEVYAVAWANGSLFAATSPHGRIYRIDPASGASSVFFDPQEAYIWALVAANDGSLIAGTGVEGRIWKIARDGRGEVLFDAPEMHVRSIAVRDGRILAGGAPEGRIYEISAGGKGRALFDSDLSEVSALWIAPEGTAWAAAVSSTLPSSAPPKPQQPAAGTQQAAPQQGTASPQAPPATGVEVSFSFDEPATPMGGGAAQIYRIDRDGFVDPVRKLEKEMIYSLGGDGSGGLLIGTGPLGRVYRLSAGELELAATVPDKQVVSVRSEGGSLWATTTNSGAVYRLRPGAGAKAEFRSAVKDTGRFSRFGQYQIDGTGVEGAGVAFRSGNTATPDETWSEWSANRGPAGTVGAPPARYLQWRLTFDAVPAGLAIDSLSASYVNRNLAPTIESVTVHDPAVVFVAGGFPTSPQVLEATNPDEYGIFNSLDTPRERTEPGKRLFRKGYRTIAWKATDPNGDSLRSSVYFRRKGTTEWFRLRENLREDQVNFDSSQLPDGQWEVKLSVTDAPDNPTAPLTTDRAAIEFTIDNSSPQLRRARRGESIEVEVTDALSPVIRAEYSVDAKEWLPILPADGIPDSQREVFSLDAKATAGRLVVLRVVDSSWNVGTLQIEP